MRERKHPATPMLEEEGSPPEPPAPSSPEEHPSAAGYAVPAAIALGFGGAVLAAAVAWGAAEAAVGVLSAYLVYDLVTGRGKANNLVLSGISRIATVLRGPGAAPQPQPQERGPSPVTQELRRTP